MAEVRIFALLPQLSLIDRRAAFPIWLEVCMLLALFRRAFLTIPMVECVVLSDSYRGLLFWLKSR